MFRKLKKRILTTTSLFYIPHLHKKIKRQLSVIDKETQIFFLTRMDFGTFIYLLHYTSCWEKLRGKTCVVVLSARFKDVDQLSRKIEPQPFLIFPDSFFLRLAIKIFGPNNMNEIILYRVYGLLLADHPNALRIFDFTMRSCYIPHFDRRLETKGVSKAFLNAYQDIRQSLNICEQTLVDYFHLHHKCGHDKKSIDHEGIKKKLGIRSDYIILNINCKKYKERGVDRKRILYPERYNVLIDRLIEKGFSVVIQGREEQPIFKLRKGLFDYSKSPFCSISNDAALFSGAYAAILSKTGPESFCTVFNTPQLGLNYSEHACLTPHVKLRFFPKYLRHKKEGRFLTWKEFLASPSFFDMGKHNYDPEIEYVDLTEEDMLAALEEFLPMVKEDKWFDYTPQQMQFKKTQTPLHLDLYHSKAVPCDIYLKKFS